MNTPRTGLRIRSLKGVDPEVRRACLEFRKWLRENYEFPTRIVLYLKQDYQIKNMKGEMVSATFFAPWDKDVEPYIRISTGDYDERCKKYGKDNALASILRSIAHEIYHYGQWLDDLPFDERKAVRGSKRIINNYAKTREHP